jgi:glycosyltransferase involved in cell wall biosynthesis
VELKTKQRASQKRADVDSDNGKVKLKVAYTMSRFPKLTETFILYEILALEKMGVQVELFPLIHEMQSVKHPEAERMEKRAHFHPFISLKILAANFHYMLRAPKKYFGALAEVLTGTFGSLNFFIGALGIFPKCARLAFEMERLGVRHLHAHFANHPAAAALIIHRLTGIPYSFTAHGSDLHVDRTMLAKKILNSAFTITVSNFNKNVMIEECGERVREKIRVVHCGADVSQFKPNFKKASSRPFQILCVASFEEVKGHRYLVEACKILKDRGVDFQCHFVGYGPLRNRVIEQVEKMGLKDEIIIHPPRPRQEIVKMLADADVKVLPSVPTKQGKREGIPVVLMEAMASGLPVVSSWLSGIPELVEDGVAGILAAPRDVNGLAEALFRLSRDPELRRRMGEAGRAKVLREFNLEKNAEELARLFLAIIDH